MTQTPPARGRSSKRAPAPDGLVIVDKPQGFTSHDVVGKMRGIAATRKVGHAGTLDPMATGVLVIGIGKATKLLTYIVGADKQYLATIRLGAATTTEDAQGDITQVSDPGELTVAEVSAAALHLTGDIMQIPSAVSAIKVDGKRSYDRVRAGEVVELAARPVTVSEFAITDVRPVAAEFGPAIDVDCVVTVSSGTYVRALARDLAAHLGTHGHLTALRRTRVGGYLLETARTLEQLQEELLADDGQAQPAISVLPLADAARAIMAVRELSTQEVTAVGYGQRLTALARETGTKNSGTVTYAGISPQGELVAVMADDGSKARPVLVLAAAQ